VFFCNAVQRKIRVLVPELNEVAWGAVRLAARCEGNNRVTFPIRRIALIDAIPFANKHIKPYEND
jgi:hypothetical protein